MYVQVWQVRREACTRALQMCVGAGSKMCAPHLCVTELEHAPDMGAAGKVIALVKCFLSVSHWCNSRF